MLLLGWQKERERLAGLSLLTVKFLHNSSMTTVSLHDDTDDYIIKNGLRHYGLRS